MEIKNRKVQYPNRVVLDVLNVERNIYGEITKIQANLLRDEGEVYEEGFVFDEKNIKLLLNQYYIESQDDNWSQVGQTSVFTIDITHPVQARIIDRNFDENELVINFETLNNKLLVRVSQGEGFDDTLLQLSRVYSFDVLLTDDYDHILGVITFTIRYVASSTNPID